MAFTAELGTVNSMPGNIALGQSQSQGGGTGGPTPAVQSVSLSNVIGPTGSVVSAAPSGSGTASVPRGSNA